MLALLAASVLAAPKYAHPIYWALNFAVTPRIPMVGDVDGDGFADLICVYPPGASIIDVSLNVDGMKAGVPIQGLTNWGENCQAAIAGQFDDAPGDDVAGLFGGQTIRLAHAFRGGRFQDAPDWIKLPAVLEEPSLISSGGSAAIAFSKKSKKAFEVDLKSKSVKDVSVSKPWLALRSNPTLPESGLPKGSAVYCYGDVDHDGDQDVFEFRTSGEVHTGWSILLYRAISPGETDSDHDGIPNVDEILTDKFNPDTDGDGLLDGWETGEFRGLKLKEMGCDPRRVDLICLISLFEQVKPELYKSEMDKIKAYYKTLPIKNPDATTGWTLHTIELDKVAAADQSKGWPELREKFRPAKWRGIVHWMQMTPWGGGQADQLGDGGGCGGGPWNMYATFIHEFGHQLGLGHEGFWGPPWCPTYSSLMNYAYSYGFEDGIQNVHYSDGRLKDYVLRETDLSEIIPLPYDKVKFLEKGPYRFHLKADGNQTLIDWNWNGVFGEQHVRADINYSYSTHAGVRDEIGKTQSAPCLFTHNHVAFVLVGKHKFPGDPKTDPTLNPDKPGSISIRRMIEPKKWSDEQTVEPEGVIGDPVATSFNGKSVFAYPTSKGLIVRWGAYRSNKWSFGEQHVLDKNVKLCPSLAVFQRRLFLFYWNPENKTIHYRSLTSGESWGDEQVLPFLSTIPISMVEDSIHDQAIIGLAQNQDANRPSRWQIRRMALRRDQFIEVSMEWIEGLTGGSRGNSRCVLLFDCSKFAGPSGKLYFFSLGSTSKQSPWSCVYVAMQVEDKTKSNGWLVKRYYDEWTQSRSNPGVCWYGDDILYAYRWADGSQGDRDNLLHIGYHGLGIETAPMGDFDDIGFMRDFGIRNSILYINR